MQVTLIGAQGFVGSAFHRLLTNRQEIKLTSVTLDNYEQNIYVAMYVFML